MATTPTPKTDEWCQCGHRESDHPTPTCRKFVRSHTLNGGHVREEVRQQGQKTYRKWVPDS